MTAAVSHGESAFASANPAETCVATRGTVAIPAGTALLGEDGEAEPGAERAVPAFRIDRTEVTNAQFAQFVNATGYVTDAERAREGAVFVQPTALHGLDAAQWWRMVRGANWRHPRGPDSNIAQAMQQPVVQVTWDDAQAYARWAGRELPTGSQWERAARGSQSGSRPPESWAYDVASGAPVANTWQGVFPLRDLAIDRHPGIAPVGCYPPNALGVYDMIGNVWEWTADNGGNGTRWVRGGSFLCAMNYCANFRPAGRQAQERDLPASHIGFRTVDSLD